MSLNTLPIFYNINLLSNRIPKPIGFATYVSHRMLELPCRIAINTINYKLLNKFTLKNKTNTFFVLKVKSLLFIFETQTYICKHVII